MARYTGPDCRQCRREGEKLFLKGEKCYSEKCPFAKITALNAGCDFIYISDFLKNEKMLHL